MTKIEPAAVSICGQIYNFDVVMDNRLTMTMKLHAMSETEAKRTLLDFAERLTKSERGIGAVSWRDGIYLRETTHARSPLR